MKVTVRFFQELKRATGKSEINLEVESLSDVLNILVKTFGEAVKDLLFDEKNNFRHFYIFLNNKVVQIPTALQLDLHEDDLLLIFPPAMGG